MKVRNFAFFGVMAAILSVSAANAAGEPAKKIASTNYVKTHAAGADYSNTTSGLSATTIQTAIDELANESATAANLETLAGRVTTAEGNITTNASDISDLESNKQDKVTTATENNITTWNAAGQTKDSGKAFTTTVRATGSTDDDSIPTESAVRTAIDTVNSATSDLAGRMTTAESDIDALESNKQDKVTTATENNITTWNAAGQTKDSGKAFTTTVRATGSTDDDSIPTESAVRAAITTATYDDTALAGRVSANETAISTINASAPMTSGIDSTKVAQIATNASDIDALETNKQDKVTGAVENNITTWNAAGQTKDSGKAFTTTVSASSTDAQIPTAAAVQTAISGAVDTAIDGVTYPTVNISGDNALDNFDGTTALNQDTHCTESSPCVLSYAGLDAQQKPKYKWTSIEDFNY